MRPVLVALLLLAAAAAALQQEVPDEGSRDVSAEPHSRPARWVVFKPMFASRAKQRQINRVLHNQELRRQWRAKGKRSRRALHFPAGGAGSGEESGLALRVAVDDLLFQSAPANDLPEPAARRSVLGAGLGAAMGANSMMGGAASTGLKPMLLARLRSASHEREPAAEEEAFLLMSTAGGRPAIVAAPTSRPLVAVRRPHKKQAPSKAHKARKGDKPRRRVARDTSTASSAAGMAALLGQRLDAMEGAMRQRADGFADRVKQYDAQGMYPAYSYTHGRYTRAADKPAVSVMKVKVRGEVDDDDDEETMEVAENVVFRPLFVHRDLKAARQDAKRRRSGLAKKPTKPAVKPLRRRQPPARHQVVAVASSAARPPAATTWFHRRTYLKHPYPSAGRRYHYQYSPYRRVVVYQ